MASAETVPCPACGVENFADETACRKCGALLHVAPPVPTVPPDRPTESTPTARTPAEGVDADLVAPATRPTEATLADAAPAGGSAGRLRLVVAGIGTVIFLVCWYFYAVPSSTPPESAPVVAHASVPVHAPDAGEPVALADSGPNAEEQKEASAKLRANVQADIAIARVAAQRGEWESAASALAAAENVLSAPEPTVDNGKEWRAIKAQIAAQHKRIDPGVKRLRAHEEAQRQRENAERAVRGPMPRISQWDGSSYDVERYLKARLNDPDSYEHVGTTEPVASGRFWIVRSQFRARNAFGGVMLQTWTFYLQNGEVMRAVPEN